MVNVQIVNQWQISATTDELRLIIRALAGRLEEHEYALAEQLARKISKTRAHATQLAMTQAEQLLNNIESDASHEEEKE